MKVIGHSNTINGSGQPRLPMVTKKYTIEMITMGMETAIIQLQPGAGCAIW
ncbi:MAG: hypothetical protein ACPLRM_02435 [Anaerolineae bacterium]